MAEVKMRAVSKFFGNVKAVNKFDLTVEDGEFVSILGPSGCGKTTMLRMIAGFEKLSEGEIWIGDQLVSSLGAGNFVPPEKRNIGMVFQSYAVWPHMNVFKNVAYPLVIKKMPKEEIALKVDRVLDLVHLTGYAERLPNQLSGGQQQRVALARALVSEPKLLLLDEPLSNLDAKLRESMRFEIKELQRKLKITVIYVTHDQAEAMAMSDRIAVMHQGVLQQKARPVNVYENPTNEIVADFIGLVNFLPAEVFAERVVFTSLNFTINQPNEKTGLARVAIRPEHITMNKEGDGVKGRLLHKFYLGDSTDCRVQAGDEVVRVINKGEAFQSYEDGEEIWLKFDKIIIFPHYN